MRIVSAAISAAVLAVAPAHAAQSLLVIELFTSQSCSSCPPADALLAELKQARRDLLPLDFHVDYWDGLGWKDPYSSAAATERQRRYAVLLGSHEVYTPQMVIDGRHQAVGSDRDAVNTAIAASVAEREGDTVPLTLARDGDHLVISIGQGAGGATLWLVGFDHQHTTHVGRGENNGRTLTEVNVVRSLTQAASWQGSPLRLTLAQPLGEESAVLLQAGNGQILAAAATERR